MSSISCFNSGLVFRFEVELIFKADVCNRCLENGDKRN